MAKSKNRISERDPDARLRALFEKRTSLAMAHDRLNMEADKLRDRADNSSEMLEALCREPSPMLSNRAHNGDRRAAALIRKNQKLEYKACARIWEKYGWTKAWDKVNAQSRELGRLDNLIMNYRAKTPSGALLKLMLVQHIYGDGVDPDADRLTYQPNGKSWLAMATANLASIIEDVNRLTGRAS
jgi:hypothetical protein